MGIPVHTTVTTSPSPVLVYRYATTRATLPRTAEMAGMSIDEPPVEASMLEVADGIIVPDAMPLVMEPLMVAFGIMVEVAFIGSMTASYAPQVAIGDSGQSL